MLEAVRCLVCVRFDDSLGWNRHIDTATNYGNEKGVGRGLRNFNRENVFLTTKLKNDDHGRVAEAIKNSLKQLQTDYIDLYLVSCPFQTFKLAASSMLQSLACTKHASAWAMFAQ